LVNDKVAAEKLGKLDNRFPIVRRSKNQLEVLVGNCRVTGYSTDEACNEDSLDAMLSDLFDFDKLEALLAASKVLPEQPIVEQ